MNQSRIKVLSKPWHLLAASFKDRAVRALAGFFIILLVLLQKLFLLDLSVVILVVALNLFQYGLTGWCPFASYFQKIGWMQNNDKESL